MEAIKSALGFDTQSNTDKGTTGDQLGELVQNKEGTSTSTYNQGGSAPQHTSGTGNSGVEPVSGKLGSGTAGQPYDAGNEEGLTGHGGGNYSSTGSGLTGALGGHSSRGAGYEGTSTSGYDNDKPSTLSGLASSLTGNSNRGTGYEGASGLTGDPNRGTGYEGTGTSGYGNDKPSTLSGLASNLIGNSNRGTGYEGTGTSGYENDNNRSSTLSDVASSLTGNSNRGTGYEGASGLAGSSTRGTGYEGTGTSGYENDNRLGAEAPEQGNHYRTTAVAGGLPSALGMDAVHTISGTHSRTTGDDSSYGRDSSYGGDSNYGNSNYGRDSSQGQGNTHENDGGQLHADTSSGYGKGLLGSDRGAGKSGDRYLFSASTAPGAGGRNHHIVDDYTDANIHNEGAGRIHDGLGSDANAGQASAGAGILNHESGSSQNDSGKERARKPGFGRLGSNVGYSSHGLNSGAPRESIGQRMENKVESIAAPAAGVAGVGAAGYGATHYGNEPLSGARGSGVAGEPYDQGNRYDGAGVTSREKQYGSGSGYGHDGVSEAASGVSDMNLRDQNRSSGFQVITPDGTPYPGTGRGVGSSSDDFSRSQDSNITGAGLAGVGAGLAGAGAAGHHHHHNTDSRDTSSSGYGSGDAILEQRIAGAPVPDDDCEHTHHSSHPTGESAHVDPSHKDTFLDYRHDHLGLPIAKGE